MLKGVIKSDFSPDAGVLGRMIARLRVLCDINRGCVSALAAGVRPEEHPTACVRRAQRVDGHEHHL